jgi:hypothetical protein
MPGFYEVNIHQQNFIYLILLVYNIETILLLIQKNI